MNTYISRLPDQFRRPARAAVLVSALVIMVGFLILLVSGDLSKPVTQMPWYFWPTMIFLFLMALGGEPSSLDIPADELSLSSAIVRLALALCAIIAALYQALFLQLTGQSLYFVVFALPFGIRGARALRRHWENRHLQQRTRAEIGRPE